MTEYRTLADFPGYRFGSDGSIWSCKRAAKFIERDGIWKRLKGTPTHAGHIAFVLHDTADHDVRHQCGHWILLAFIGPRPEGMGCLHGDGNPTNNRIGNLRWGTQYENAQDSKRHGTMVKGERVGSAKVTEADVLRMRELSEAGVMNKEIGGQFGLDETVISRIVRGERWPHVGGPVRTHDKRFGVANVYGHMVRKCQCGRTIKGPSYFLHAKACRLLADVAANTATV